MRTTTTSPAHPETNHLAESAGIRFCASPTQEPLKSTMLALTRRKYGGPEAVKLEELQLPRPKPTEILVRNRAVSLTRADTFFRRGTPCVSRLFFGLIEPKQPVLGTGYAGEIVKVGKSTAGFKVGDRVYGESGTDFGAHAEYVCLTPDKHIVRPIPEGLSFEEASGLCDGALTSYNFLMNIAGLEPGRHVAVVGASGALGSAAVQFAKNIGAIVTAVCSDENATWVKALGADHVINYREEDFTRRFEHFDVVYDTVGASTFRKVKPALKPNGVYVNPVLSAGLLAATLFSAVFGNKKAKFDATGLRKPKELHVFLAQIESWIEMDMYKPVMEQTLPVDRAQAAHRYVDSGRKRGNLALTFDWSPPRSGIKTSFCHTPFA